MPVIAIIFFGALGACIGSFVNVVGVRSPKGQSSIGGRSHCPRCHNVIAWHDNVPVISWVALRGQCRRCHEPISIRYPVGEAAGAVVFAGIAALVRGIGPLVVGLIVGTVVLTIAQLVLGRHHDTYASRRE